MDAKSMVQPGDRVRNVLGETDEVGLVGYVNEKIIHVHWPVSQSLQAVPTATASRWITPAGMP